MSLERRDLLEEPEEENREPDFTARHVRRLSLQERIEGWLPFTLTITAGALFGLTTTVYTWYVVVAGILNIICLSHWLYRPTEVPRLVAWHFAMIFMVVAQQQGAPLSPPYTVFWCSMLVFDWWLLRRQRFHHEVDRRQLAQLIAEANELLRQFERGER